MNESREASAHALVGAYAIDAVDAAERAQFEDHLTGCAECRAELAGLREAAALIGGTEEIAPPAGVRDRVLAGIAAERPADPHAARTPIGSDDAPTGPPLAGSATGTGTDRGRDADVVVLSRRRFRMAAGAVAAAVLVAVGAGAVVVNQLGDDAAVQQAQPTLAERVQEADDAEEVAVELDGGAKATVVRSVALNRAVVVTEDMPPPPEGMVYELWLDDKEKGFTPAGLMSTTSDQTLVLQGDAARASRVAVTVEPAEGSSVPTSEPIVVFPFDSGQA